GLRRVDWALRLHPDIVILELGANDALRGQDLATVRANLSELVERFKAGGARGLPAGMRLPPDVGGGYGEAVGRREAGGAERGGVAFMPFFLDGVGGTPRLNQPDGIHPTAEGYRIIVDKLWGYLTPLLRS